MLRKWICLMGAACMLMAMTLAVCASEGKGSIRVTPVWGGKQIAGGEISVSRVGDKEESGFCITDGLADWTVSEQEILSGQWINWIQSGESVRGEVNMKGETVFEGLTEGVYLVQQTKTPAGFLPFSSFLLSIPEGDNRNVTRKVKMVLDAESPQTGDRHIPLIGAMGLGLSAAILMVLIDQHKE